LAYEGRFLARSSTLVIKLPRRLLEARVGGVTDMTARIIRPHDDEAGLASALVALLPDHAAGLAPGSEALIRDQVLDLAAVSLMKVSRGGPARISNARSLVLLKVRAAVEARLCDPALSPEAVARAAGFSVRYANAVLAEQDLSILRFIQSRRLERCRQALEDPAHDHRTVSEIAFGWGFSDMTHFGRRFKAAYGRLPSEVRKARRARGASSA
jgi:AraC family transcriptional regulator, positive regulator of tynA and feaB